MTTQHIARPRTFREAEQEVERRGRTCRFCIDHGINALTVFLFGLGVLSVFVGLCTEVLTPGQGIVGGVALGVLGHTTRVYYGRWVYSNTTVRRREKAPAPEVEYQIETRYVWDPTKLAWVEATEHQN